MTAAAQSAVKWPADAPCDATSTRWLTAESPPVSSTACGATAEAACWNDAMAVATAAAPTKEWNAATSCTWECKRLACLMRRCGPVQHCSSDHAQTRTCGRSVIATRVLTEAPIAPPAPSTTAICTRNALQPSCEYGDHTDPAKRPHGGTALTCMSVAVSAPEPPIVAIMPVPTPSTPATLPRRAVDCIACKVMNKRNVSCSGDGTGKPC